MEDLIGCVRLAEEQGFHSAWVVESYADVFSVLSACAVVTESIQLATGVATVFTRNPTTIAIASATVDTVSRGRFILGLGSEHREIHTRRDSPDRLSPVPFRNARQRLRETAEVVRAVIKAAASSDSVSYRGEVFEFENYEPWFVPYRDRVPVYLAALTPGTMELAGEVADGVVPVYFSPERMKKVVEQVATGAKRVGRNPASVDVACYLPVCVSEDRAEAYRALRYMVSNQIFTHRYYRDYFTGIGYGRGSRACWIPWRWESGRERRSG